MEGDTHHLADACLPVEDVDMGFGSGCLAVVVVVDDERERVACDAHGDAWMGPSWFRHE